MNNAKTSQFISIFNIFVRPSVHYGVYCYTDSAMYEMPLYKVFPSNVNKLSTEKIFIIEGKSSKFAKIWLSL